MLDPYSKVLVTGGLGFIGRHLVSALLSLGKEVIIVDNLSTASGEAIPSDVTFIQADVRDPRQITRAAQGTELLFHVAANASGTLSVENPRFDFETNALGTFNVLEAALRVGAGKVVYVSSASVYGRPQRVPIDEEHPANPFVPYGASKLCGEVYCRVFSRTYGLPVVISRPFCVYGPGENPKTALVEVSRYLRWHLNGRPIPIVGDSDRKTRDFVHVRDLVQGLLLMADRAPSGEVYNVGSGEEVSMRELAEIICSVTGRKAAITEIPQITEDTYRLVADISKLRALGYNPEVTLPDGVRQLVKELGEAPELPGGATIFRKGQRAEEQTAR
jgi:nucleoside-diphosphate-sugar epimerase